MEAAKCVVVLWSKQSINSEWVLEEANNGKRRQILVPAKIDSVDPPLGFGLIQAADLADWEADTSHSGFVSLLNAISEIAGPPRRRQGEPVSAFLPPKPDGPAATEPKPYKPRKTRNALQFGVVAGVVVLLIVGIWWWVSRPQVNEIRQEIEKLDRQALNLESAVAKVDKPEQIEELYKQRDTLSHQVEGFSEQATKVGLESQLEQLQDRLKQVQIQLANKEKELIAARKGKIFVVEMVIRGTGHLASYVKFRKALNTISGVEGIRVAVDQIRTISKQRLKKKVDKLSKIKAAQLRKLITDM